MTGLIVKDIRQLAQKKKYFLMFGVIALVLAFSMDDTFIISYITMIGMVLAISTISYDEFDNGLAFLMTLPVTRKQYALEKHLFGCCLIFISSILGLVLHFVSCLLKGTNYDIKTVIPTSIVFFAVFCMIMSILVPIELHFGIEKSRVVMLIIFGGVFAIGILGKTLTEKFNIDPTLLLSRFQSISPAVLIGSGVAAVLLILIATTGISVAVMEKKEF